MTTAFINVLASMAALLVGTVIGIGFGRVQEAARRRNEQRQLDGSLKSGWAVMPGSGARVAYLLIGLLLIQLICPLLFRDGVQWWVSAGVVGGYGFMLFRQLRQRLPHGK
jgi:hypothetical protein